MARTIVHTDELTNLTFGAKSSEYPAGRCAFLDDGMVFPELRFTPEPGKDYDCNVRFFQKEGNNRKIGIAFPIDINSLSDEEYDRENQIKLAVIFLQEQDSCLIAQHPYTGAYIFPTKDSEAHIKPGIQCWVTLVQRGSILIAHFIKDVEIEGEQPPLSEVRTIAVHDSSFAQMAEEAIVDKYGQGKPPMFRFGRQSRFPWDILGIPKTADLTTIRKTYRKLAANLHPDTNENVNVEDYKAVVHSCDWLCAHQEWLERISKKTAAPTPVAAVQKVRVLPLTKVQKDDAAPVITAPEPEAEIVEPVVTADTTPNDPVLVPFFSNINDDVFIAMIAGGVNTLGQLAKQKEKALQDLLGGSKKVKISVVRMLINTANNLISRPQEVGIES